MNAQERLRQLIDQESARLRAGIPRDRPAAIAALIRAVDRLPLAPGRTARPDVVSGNRLANPGGNRALQLCLEPGGIGAELAGDALDRWAGQLLDACGQIAAAESVLAHVETGFMRIGDGREGQIDAWVATKRAPTSWRERADVDWWASSLVDAISPELRALDADPSGGDAANLRRAELLIEAMAYQFGYPPDGVLDGIDAQRYLDLLKVLIAGAIGGRNRGEEASWQSERALVAGLAAALHQDPGEIAHIVSALTLTPENASYHAAVAGVAAAPLVRLGDDAVIVSSYGLLSEPLLFLTRELRRRSAEAYNNSGYLRELLFRQNLYELFQDKRFVTITGRINLRRADGGIRTDIDAAIFDRKSGTLGLFELKSQDPFARSTAELTRQRDSVLYANRQVSGVLDWIKRRGADEILARVDPRTAKTFRAQKVYPFVLGRYLAHFNDGPEPDRRAAWGTWPQLLRLIEVQPIRATDSNPIASLHARLQKDGPPIVLPADMPPREISLGPAARVVVYPTYAAYQEGAGNPESAR